MPDNSVTALLTGGVVGGVLITLKAFDMLIKFKFPKFNGSVHEANVERAITKLSVAMHQQTEIMKTYGDKIEGMSDVIDRVDRWHAEEIPGQPGQKKVWQDTHKVVSTISRNVKLLCRENKVTYVDD